jgi:diketogulonate reductase-like aldo/keto reductase
MNIPSYPCSCIALLLALSIISQQSLLVSVDALSPLSGHFNDWSAASSAAGIGDMARRRTLITPVAAAIAAASSGLLLPPAMASVLLPTTTTKTLSDGSVFPLASFGLQIYDDATAYRLTTTALKVGFRNFFASVLAGNQRGFAQAIRDSGIARSDLYICGSVVSNRAQGFASAYKATEKGWQANMQAFGAGGIDYIDQIMLDYPGPDCESIRGQWAALDSMYEQKLTKSLSVSNFSPQQLDCILLDPKTRVKPVVNQLPFSVAYHPDGANSIVQENIKRGVLVQAWAPLGYSVGGRFNARIKEECANIGKPYDKSWAQVALRWIVQHGAAFTVQSKNMEHFAQDLNIYDFALTDQEMQTLDALFSV